MDTNNQTKVITINDKQYRVSDFNADQIEILNSLLMAENKIATARRELAIFQAGRESMMATLELLLKDVSPVEAQAS